MGRWSWSEVRNRIRTRSIPSPFSFRPSRPRPVLVRSRRAWHLGLAFVVRVAQEAKTGFRWTSYLAGPIAVVALIYAFVVIAFGVGSGRGWPVASGWGVATPLIWPFGFYFALGLCGGFGSGVIGLIGP